MSQPEHSPVVVGILYPTDWEVRPRELLDADLAALAAIDARIEVIEARYLETSELRGRRGADPAADLRSEAPELPPQVREALARVEVVLAMDLPFDVGQLAPNLRWVQGMGAGVSQLASAGLADAGIALTTAAGVNAVSISEFVLARLLQMWKRLPEIDALASRHTWEPTYGREVDGMTLGIAGLGAIGRQVARRARALGMTVLAQRRSAVPGDTDPDVDELFGPAGLPEILRRSDAVVAACPKPLTPLMFSMRSSSPRCGRAALFVNVGRGSAVVDSALIEALKSGHLAGAAIDVARTEPLPPDSPLWEAPNLLISPHSATAPAKFWSNLHELFRDNMGRYLRGEPLRNEVDARVGG